ncbi:cytochrome c [Solemya velesiana gill symbiont]|uniref:Green heme protein n=1 Tax=Solemya velesiana gill symbiont TaxID=1918948 RepID=A0A1T2KS81_9GAMM|nr:cytochrome c [Solemya velesiana gill symbiont]OOZ35729.1 hypothetical protein BOW51_10540 [Solemya velesiana gill symbiont]
MRALVITGILLAAVTSSVQAETPDADTGKELVNENCYSCHGNDVYTRGNRMVQSRVGLSKQVRRCKLSLGLQWFDEDVENAAEYLNLKFYHFNK